MKVFLERQPLAIQKTNSMLKVDKIKEILDLDCFNERQVIPKRAPRVYHHQTTLVAPTIQPMRQKSLSYHDKLIREVTGNLNKLNTSNLVIICKRVQRIIDNDNLEEITLLVLNSACNEHSIYMFQLLDMLNALPDSYQNNINGIYTKFANKVVIDLDDTMCVMHSLDFENNYDEYCSFLKKKKIVINQFILLYKLIEDYEINISQETAFDSILHNFITYHDTTSNMQVFLIEMTQDFFKHFKKDHIHCFYKFMHMVEKEKLSTKAKFIYEDIIKM